MWKREKASTEGRLWVAMRAPRRPKRRRRSVLAVLVRLAQVMITVYAVL